MKCHKTMDEQPGTSKKRNKGFVSYFWTIEKCFEEQKVYVEIKLVSNMCDFIYNICNSAIYVSVKKNFLKSPPPPPR
jgi:hypothetical protein